MQASDEIVSLIKDPEDLGDSTMLWERVADDESESDYFLLRSNAHPDKYVHAFIDAIPEREKEFNTLIHGFEFRIYSKSFLDERINRQPFFPRSAVVQARRNHRDIGTMSRCFLRIYLVNHVKCPGAFSAYEVSSQ